LCADSLASSLSCLFRLSFLLFAKPGFVGFFLQSLRPQLFTSGCRTGQSLVFGHFGFRLHLLFASLAFSLSCFGSSGLLASCSPGIIVVAVPV
jgi:hypothetical protein